MKTMMLLTAVAVFSSPLIYAQDGAEEPRTPPTTVEELVADPKVQEMIYEEVNLPAYGFLLHKSGNILGVHGPDGRILIDNVGEFIFQKLILNEAGGVTGHEHYGWVHASVRLKRPRTEWTRPMTSQSSTRGPR